jgi:hypothetical protein
MGSQIKHKCISQSVQHKILLWWKLRTIAKIDHFTELHSCMVEKCLNLC